MDTVDREHDDLIADAKAYLDALDADCDVYQSEALNEDDAVYEGEALEDDALKEDNESASPPHDTALDGLKRARKIKDDISGNMLYILASKATRVRGRTVEEDPDNQLIKVMRQEHSMTWDAIVMELNKQRLERGEAQTWTAAAVYSRFVRNAPRIAAAKGEYGFRPQDCE